MRLRTCTLLCAALTGACAGPAQPPGFTPAPHPPLPQVQNLGGTVLTSPSVQPIAYADDPDLPDLQAFLPELVTTSYWHETTFEYGVGTLQVRSILVRPAPAPPTLTDDQMQADLAQNLTGASPAWGPLIPGTIYLFLVPVQTAVSSPTGTGCKDYDGYHTESHLAAGVEVPYAMSCACNGYGAPGLTDLQERTLAISHELVESATDPFPNTGPAYLQEDVADIVWTYATGGEVADLCELDHDAAFVPPGGTYTVQRSWSNRAAGAGTNPCVPLGTSGPYFNTVPVLPDVLAIPGGGSTLHPPGVRIPVGGSRTLDLDLYSDAPTAGPWTVKAYDGSSFRAGPTELALVLDRASGQNGDTLHLTVTVLKADPSIAAEPFFLVSDLDGQSNVWMAFVGQ